MFAVVPLLLNSVKKSETMEPLSEAATAAAVASAANERRFLVQDVVKRMLDLFKGSGSLTVKLVYLMALAALLYFIITVNSNNKNPYKAFPWCANDQQSTTTAATTP